MNMYYKGIFMETISKCTTNPIVFEGDFKPPLTKRYMIVDKCIYTTEGFPSHMAEGLYKLPVSIHGPVDVCLEATVRIEREAD